MADQRPEDFKVDIDLDAIEAASVRGHALDFPGNAISSAIDRGVVALAAVFNWIWLLLIVLIVVNVLLRYVAGTNFIAMEELQWHLYAVGFLLGLGYAVSLDGHVRVDVLAEHWPERRRAWIEFFGILLLAFPFVAVVVAEAIPFVSRSYMINEVSAAPGGLKFRWIIKSFIIIAFVYLGFALLARFLRVCTDLFGVPAPRPK
jgi:TRAP-type mannitol/chloroaromatic compound transport system permease small subunit